MYARIKGIWVSERTGRDEATDEEARCVLWY